ncbi:pectinesterase 3-like [Populus nigra]|uniref:pectinesterase 3-like n=1 Tax=Populus nigra TaxID=3691 RepID=UPI002B279E36|nr:pectinesterase 3-like [Populus nigra]
MDLSHSFTSQSKVDEQAEQAFRRKARKRLIVIVVSAVVLVTIIICALVGTPVSTDNKSKGKNPSSQTSEAQSIRAMCNATRYPDSCYSSMSSSLKASSIETNPNPDPKTLFLLSLQVSLIELTKLSSLPQWIMSSNSFKNEISDSLVQSALHACEILFLDAVDQVNESMSSIQVGQGDKTVFLTSKINDIRTRLSTAITDQDTCIAGLQDTAKHLILTDVVRYAMTNSNEFTSNSLAIASNIVKILDDQLGIPIHRKLLTVDHDLDMGFPSWVNISDRRLLQQENPEPNLTVAKDGSGAFKTIREAVDSIPKNSKSRFVIYVKEGIYVENVKIEKQQWNVMMYGDGMNKTIISGSLNNVDGVTKFLSGTLIAEGRGFIAKDIGFKNTAGPQKEQAVAVRSSSDQSIFHRCSFDAYQDTLYTHSNRQFYRECQIIGTIDFIFGNAAAIFQNCTIQPRQPMEKQNNTITAQSRTDPNQNTGISIQQCQMTPFDNLTVPTFLGRPWRDHATTVIMQSYIGDFLDPLGWIPWEPETDPPNTTFYAEYQNFGPGSAIDKRAGWLGVLPNITYDEAAKFTVEPFIQGRQWLVQANVFFQDTL